MTEGHKHTIVRVKEKGWVERVLRKPLYHTCDFNKVYESPYPYGPCDRKAGMESACWYLSALSILHRWTGLTLLTGSEPDE